jgi:phage terminase Nu1 subunit (DNA packaging protein)
MVARGGVVIGSSYDEARTKKMNADAELAQLELLKARGELVAVDDVRNAWVDVLGAMRGKLLAIPTKAAPLISTETDIGLIQNLIEKQIHEALNELASYEPEQNAGRSNIIANNDEGSVDNSKAAASSKRKRVGRPRKASVIREQC